MKKRQILKVLLIGLGMMMNTYVAEASDDITIWGGTIGKTSFYDFNKILEERGIFMTECHSNSALFKGIEDGDSVIVFTVFNNGHVDALLYKKQIPEEIAEQKYDEFVSLYREKYPTFAYIRKNEDNKKFTYLMSEDSYILVELSSTDKKYEIMLNYSLKDLNMDDIEEPDDTFEPDFKSDYDPTLFPKELDKIKVEWFVSDEVMLESGRKDKLWIPKMRIICRADGQFLLTILRPAKNGYYKVCEGDNCYIRLDNDSIVTLKLNTEYSPWNYEREGYFYNNILKGKMYWTQTFYDIDDIMQLANSNIIKIRWIEDDKPYDIEYTDKKWAKTFNKSFHDAILQAYKKQKEKSAFNEDKLSGF